MFQSCSLDRFKTKYQKKIVKKKQVCLLTEPLSLCTISNGVWMLGFPRYQSSLGL